MTRDTPSNWFAIALLALLIVFAVPLAAWSQEQQGFAKVGGYAGGSFLPAFTLDGETFNGLTYYKEIDGDEIALLPKLDKQKMFRGILGYRYERAALELSYERTNHNGTFGGIGTGQATFQQVNADVRFFFLIINVGSRIRTATVLLIAMALSVAMAGAQEPPAPQKRQLEKRSPEKETADEEQG